MTAHDRFFQEKQAAAVLKHGILERYPTVFASKTGSKAVGGRVVYLDGFAGPGRYEPENGQSEGAEGSPLLAVRTADRVEKFRRTLRCVFVERSSKHFVNLQQTLKREAPTLDYEVLKGDVSQYLDTVLTLASGQPMLAFLDPFGTGLPYAEMTGRLLRRPKQPATEVLLNFNLQSVWRIGGLLADAGANDTAGFDTLLGDDWLPVDDRAVDVGSADGLQRSDASLARIDSFLGNEWWRDVFRDARTRAETQGEHAASARAAQRVALDYCRRIEADTGYQAFSVPIRREVGHEPLFMMILFYRYTGSPFVFNEAVSKANEKWRQFTNDRSLRRSIGANEPDDLFGGTMSELVVEQNIRTEDKLNQAWIDTIKNNIVELVTAGRVIDVQGDTRAVYRTTLGLARTTHLRQAWDQLADQGLVHPRRKDAKIENQTISRK